MEASIRLIGSTSASNSSAASAPSLQIVLGWSPTTSGALHRCGTMRSNKMKACRRGSVSASCANSTSVPRRRARAWLSWPGSPSSHRSRIIRIATTSSSATNVTFNARQKAQLYVGGLPEHIRVHVEMHHPPDLQTAMYYARAYKHRTAAFLLAL